VLGAKEELWLQQLAEDAGEERRLDAVGGEEFWSNVEALWSSGHERLALSWIEKFVLVPAVRGDPQLGLRVGWSSYTRGAATSATPPRTSRR
jgi:hypothetical protein